MIGAIKGANCDEVLIGESRILEVIGESVGASICESDETVVVDGVGIKELTSAIVDFDVSGNGEGESFAIEIGGGNFTDVGSGWCRFVVGEGIDTINEGTRVALSFLKDRSVIVDI